MIARIEQRRLFGTLVAVTVGAVLLSLAPMQQTLGAIIPCGESSPECNGSCAAGQLCFAFSRGGTVLCACRNVGCCRIADSNSCVDNASALGCLFQNGSVWGRGETCASGCLATNPGDPNGSSCTDAVDCMSDNCVEGVCCDTACDGPAESCNAPGRQGTCIAEIPAAAPAASQGGLLLITLVLAATAAVAFWRRRET